jgi:hypothetical protein
VSVGIVLLFLVIIIVIVVLHRGVNQLSDLTVTENELSVSETESQMYEGELDHEYVNPLDVHRKDIDIFSNDIDTDPDISYSDTDAFHFTLLE